MADKLSIYNFALLAIEERNIASLTENREPRRVLDQLWTPQVNFCLEQGFWKHAKRVLQMPASTTVIPQFGYNCAVAIPNDWIKTYVISSSPSLTPPLLDYKTEAGYIFSNADPLYLDYISSDPSYGWNLGRWSQTFANYVGYNLGKMAAGRLAKSDKIVERVTKLEYRGKRDAKAIDAMNDPPGFSPTSSWIRARRGNTFGNNDGGSGSPTGGSVNMGPG